MGRPPGNGSGAGFGIVTKAAGLAGTLAGVATASRFDSPVPKVLVEEEGALWPAEVDPSLRLALCAELGGLLELLCTPW